MVTIKYAVWEAVQKLYLAQIDLPRLEAELLLAHLLGQERTWLYTHDTETLSSEINITYQALLKRRSQHEPLAYLLGEREFFGLPFYVTPAVLIPRPETELLVELAAQFIQANSFVVEIGTGSGCIAVSIALHYHPQHLIATDISAPALAVAHQNVKRHQVSDRVQLIQANLLTPVTHPLDLLISNPPYIPQDDLATLASDVRDFEPHLALIAGASGLTLIEKILQDATFKLKPGGGLLLEFGAGQGATILALAKRYCPQATFELKQDLAGHNRILIGYF